MKDESVVFSQNSLFHLMDILKSFYWNVNLKIELNRILSMYSYSNIPLYNIYPFSFHLFVSNRYKLALESDFNDEIRLRLITNLEDMFLHYILEEAASLSSPSSDHKEKEKCKE